MRLKEIEKMTVIHCNSLLEVAELLDAIRDKEDYTPQIWNLHRENTCIRTDGEKFFGFDKTDYYIEKGYKITDFSDLIIPELSAKEVLETMKEICDEIFGCDNHCPLWNHCTNKEFGSKAEETIDICTKWREEHPKEEKKELETEWVYVVRIIKVHDNGKKECVHEVVCNIEFSDMDKVAEAELKHYCSEHEGNFFATLEHICRIKE